MKNDTKVHRHMAHVVLSETHGLSPDHHADALATAREHLAALLPEGATFEDLKADAIAASEERSRILAEHPTEARRIVLDHGEALSPKAQTELESCLIDHKKAHNDALEGLDAREMAFHHADLVRRLDEHVLAQAEAELDAEGPALELPDLEGPELELPNLEEELAPEVNEANGPIGQENDHGIVEDNDADDPAVE